MTCTFFTSQNKVGISRHRTCFRWHYILISPFAFFIAFSSSKFFLLPHPVQKASAAIIAQCRTRERFQSEGTSEGHLVQPPAPSRAKCCIRAGCWRPFLDKTCENLQQPRLHLLSAAHCCASPRSSCKKLSFFRSHGNFSCWNLWLLSFVFMLQNGADPVSSLTTL